MPRARSFKPRSHGIANGYRSGLEEAVAGQLSEAGVAFEYEPKDGKIQYTKPERVSKYTPDFPLPDHGFIIETKGRFTVEDRQKHILIKEQCPSFDIRFVFSNSRARISKTSKTTYADWCTKHGFKFADKLVPQAWLNERKQK